MRQDYKASLTGEGAQVDLKGIWMLSGHNQAHVHVMIDHQVPNCRSTQLFKGIVDDVGQSRF